MKNLSLYEHIPSLENNFTVKFRLYENDSALVPHWHEHIELMYLLDGECDFICNGRTFSAKGGDLLIINETEVHSFEVKRHLVFFSILLFPSFFADIDFKGIILDNFVVDDKEIKSFFDDIYSEYNNKETASDMMMKSHTYRLVAYLARNYGIKKLQKTDTSISNAKLDRLNTVIEYISKNYTEKITTSDLAAMCFLNESHFCRFFKGAVGKSCTEYINQYRIEKASVLLTNTIEPITTIAYNVGFDDINYFSRVFKKVKGTTPGKYRLQKETENTTVDYFDSHILNYIEENTNK